MGFGDDGFGLVMFMSCYDVRNARDTNEHSPPHGDIKTSVSLSPLHALANLQDVCSDEKRAPRGAIFMHLQRCTLCKNTRI